MGAPYPVSVWRCRCGETWDAVVQWPCRRCGQLPEVIGPARLMLSEGEDLRGFRRDERWMVRVYGE